VLQRLWFAVPVRSWTTLYALTALFTGHQKNGDANASSRRNNAVKAGLVGSLLETVWNQGTARFAHSVFGTLTQLLQDPGDGSNAAARQDAAIASLYGGSKLQQSLQYILQRYPDHSGVQVSGRTLIAILGPAIERAEAKWTAAYDLSELTEV